MSMSSSSAEATVYGTTPADTNAQTQPQPKEKTEDDAYTAEIQDLITDARIHDRKALIEIVVAALRNPKCKLTWLSFWDDNIEDIEAVAIAEALKDHNCKLKEISLWKNNIGQAGATAIANALIHPNCTLNEVDLEENDIGQVGAKALAQAVVFCRKQGRKITVKGVDNFENLIAKAEKEYAEKILREKLEVLSKTIAANLANEVSLSNCTVLDPALETKPRKLTVTDLNPIFIALNENKSVTTIDLSNNSEIDAKVIEPLMQVLSGNYGWSWWGNTFSTEVPNALINCIDLRETKITKADAEKLFNHAQSLVTKPPRVKFNVFYNGGELKFSVPKEKSSQETKDAQGQQESSIAATQITSSAMAFSHKTTSLLSLFSASYYKPSTARIEDKASANVVSSTRSPTTLPVSQDSSSAATSISGSSPIVSKKI